MKGNICSITNCKNLITHKGTICGTHKWRFAKHNSYDLPSYSGEPNIPIVIKLPDGILKICSMHGALDKDNVYSRYYKGTASYACKPCALSKNIHKKYEGMSGLEDYETMLVKQNGVCAMCSDQNNTTRNGKIKRFAIDHCHTTKKVRGLLCSFCNSLLGYAKDDISILQSAIDYLKAST